MNNAILLLALAVAPLGLSAQHKPAARKPTTSSVRSTATRPTTRPAHASTVAKAPAAEPIAASAPTTAPAITTRPEAAVVSAPATPPATSTAKATKPAPVAQVKISPERTRESGFRVGFRAGGSGATVSGASADAFGSGTSIEPVTGFHAGLVLSFGRRAFTIQPEVLYSQYGFNVTAGTDYARVKYNLVEVPVMLKYTFGQSTMRFFVNAGPTATYLLNGTITVKEGGETSQADIPIGPNDGRINYGGSLGLGVAMKAGSGSFQLEARGTYLKTSDGNTSLQNAKLSVAYLLPLGGR
ncbi:outer membrane beta-barrel protein [Fibrella sp. HMF5335]|uniref:Outer membrane beta-barrel protein n=1 Tax=Fibrella rubiginis TaxID=2817060 RepID=A0A939K476_9BACT|nr:porin family protein [Fibrella rubiginis]MBO0935876.1 outer membrane beta-barrel protein [Fibrella rubiginis]